MRVVFLGNALSVESGHSRLAWKMARHLLTTGHSCRIIASMDKKSNISVRHASLIAEEGYDDLWEDRLEFRPGELRPDNGTLRGKLAPVLSEADVVHIFDMRAIWALDRMFGGRIPTPTVLQVSSLPNLALRHIISAGPGALLQAVTSRVHAVSAVAPVWYVAKLFRPASIVVCTSQFLASILTNRYGVRKESLRVVPPGVEPASDVQPSSNDHPDFIYFGWPGAHRGTLDAARAFARFLQEFPDADCLVCAFAHSRFLGEDTLILRALKRRFARQGVRNAGFLPDIRRRLCGVRAAVLPFRSPFGYAQSPIVVLEAMAAGVPVISTDVGSVREILRDGENGFLVRRGDVAAMSKYMRRLWIDDDLYAKMSAAAKATVREHYSLEQQLARTMQTYERLIGNRPG